jgi:hypothetical protein
LLHRDALAALRAGNKLWNFYKETGSVEFKRANRARDTVIGKKKS